MNFPFKAILFDWAYTLVDLVNEDGSAAFRKAIRFLESRGISIGDYEELYQTCQEMFEDMIRLSRQTHREARFEDVLKYLLFERKSDLSGQAGLNDLLTVYYKEIYVSRRVYPEVKSTLETLKSMNVRMGIISNTTNPGFMKDYERVSVGLDSYFEFAIYSSEVPFRKPHPSIFKLAIRRLNLDPREILFVGDQLSDDVAGAHGVGIPAAWVNRGKAALSDGFRPDFEITSLADLLTLESHKVIS